MIRLRTGIVVALLFLLCGFVSIVWTPYPVAGLKLLASKRSVGKTLEFRDKPYKVEELTADAFKGVDIAFFSAGATRSREFAPAAKAAGAVVIDNSSAFRMDPSVPLVVPEVNPGDLHRHKGLIANPNCTAAILATAVWPIHQAVEGYDTKVAENGYNEEENKVVEETRKMFHAPELAIQPTCIRVPVLRAHAEAITLELEAPMSPEEARALLSRSPGLKIVDDPKANHFPMPLEASGDLDVHVGRIRRDLSNPNGLVLFVAGDQLLKGAAWNAVQIAEELASLTVAAA